MITTEKIQLTSKNIFKILLTIDLKKRWWLYVWFWLLGISIIYIKNRNSTAENIIICVLFLYPFIGVLDYWIFAYSKDNKLYLLERYYNIYEDKILGILSDGTESTIKIEHFIKVIQMKSYYLLYITKNQFIYIPINSFKNEQDKNWFDKEIIMKIKK